LSILESSSPHILAMADHLDYPNILALALQSSIGFH
jgi:hypothetical protein